MIFPMELLQNDAQHKREFVSIENTFQLVYNFQLVTCNLQCICCLDRTGTIIIRLIKHLISFLEGLYNYALLHEYSNISTRFFTVYYWKLYWPLLEIGCGLWFLLSIINFIFPYYGNCQANYPSLNSANLYSIDICMHIFSCP